MKPLAKKIFQIFIFSIISALITMTSCQKVISLNLKDTTPQLVVEANIFDTPGPYYVKLSKSSGFDNIGYFPPVTGATVQLSDSTGNLEILTELKDGIYISDKIVGTPGRKYYLSIETEGNKYEATSVMPYPVDDVNLTITKEVNDRPSFGGTGTADQPRYQVNYEIKDPENARNYYRFVATRKNREISSRRVFDDQYHNGKIIADEFGLRDTIDFQPGDTVGIELQCIDEATYNFYRTLRDGTAGLSFLSASPSNPITNISNNGLGYFSASSVHENILIIPLQ